MRDITKILTGAAAFCLLFSAAITTASAQSDAAIKDFTIVTRGVKSTYAPDRRVKVFDLKLTEEKGELAITGCTTEPEAKKSVLADMAKLGYKVTDKIEILPSESLKGKVYGVATQSVINLRMDGDYDAESGTQMMMGGPVTILRKSGGWSQVRTPEGYISWVTSGSVAEMTKEEFAEYTAKKKVVLTARFGVVTEEPKMESQPVCDAVWGNIFIDLGKSGKFRKVALADGRTGYLPAASVKDFEKWLAEPVRSNPTADDIIATAKQFVGVPYMWGATSIKAVDCSGFTKSTYFLCGLILARDASQQCYTGDNVDIRKYVNEGQQTTEALANLKKGDLIFFGRKATADKKERITHVGIYIGDGIFIHSATKVRINSLIPTDQNYYEGSTRLVRAQRILGNQDCGKGIISIKESEFVKVK